jgi:hypothetical protein
MIQIDGQDEIASTDFGTFLEMSLYCSSSSSSIESQPPKWVKICAFVRKKNSDKNRNNGNDFKDKQPHATTRCNKETKDNNKCRNATNKNGHYPQVS